MPIFLFYPCCARGAGAEAFEDITGGRPQTYIFQTVACQSWKRLIKLILIGGVLTVLMWPERERPEALTRSELSGLLPLSLSLTLKSLGSVVAMLTIVAAADYLFQYRQWHERQKMSVRELKEEFK